MSQDEAGEVDAERQRLAVAYARRKAVASRYSPFSSAHQRLVQERERRTLAMLEKSGITDLSPLRILEIGCGTGSELLRCLLWGASRDRLIGVEALPERVAEARERLPGVTIHHADARELPFPDGSFDLVVALTLFSSLPDPAIQQRVASEAWRILVPGGRLLWYDMRMTDPRNRDLVPLGARRVRALFPEGTIALSSCTLLPPLARAIASLPGTGWLHDLLAGIPVLRGHYLGIIRKS